MRRLLNTLRDRLGLPGMLSLGLFATGLLLHFIVLRPMQHRLDQLDTQLAGMEQRSADKVPADPSAQLEAFYGFFDTREDRTAWLARLDAIARASGVDLSAGQYTLRDDGTPLTHYEVTLPLSGSYPQIRAFLDKSLREIPVLSLDQVNFQRRNADELQVRADVRLSLHGVKK